MGVACVNISCFFLDDIPLKRHTNIPDTRHSFHKQNYYKMLEEQKIKTNVRHYIKYKCMKNHSCCKIVSKLDHITIPLCQACRKKNDTVV